MMEGKWSWHGCKRKGIGKGMAKKWKSKIPWPHRVRALGHTMYAPLTTPCTCPGPHHVRALDHTMHASSATPCTHPRPHHVCALSHTMYAPSATPCTRPQPHHVRAPRPHHVRAVPTRRLLLFDRFLRATEFTHQ